MAVIVLPCEITKKIIDRELRTFYALCLKFQFSLQRGEASENVGVSHNIQGGSKK